MHQKSRYTGPDLFEQARMDDAEFNAYLATKTRAELLRMLLLRVVIAVVFAAMLVLAVRS